MRLVNDPAMREKLGITDEQAAKIRQQTFDFQKAEIRDRADVQVRRLELNQLLTAANPDRAAIDQKLEQISATRLAQRKLEVNYRLDMRAALTSEQRQKLQNLREEFRHPAAPRRHMQPPNTQGS
jgi:Spy/CpxP family protein refolding chaperone